MRTDLSRALEECLVRIRRGEPFEACLGRYPHLRQRLEPLLETALSIAGAPKEVPSDEFRMASKARLVSRLRASAAQGRAEEPRRAAASGGLGLALRTLASAAVLPRRVAVPLTSALFLALAGLLVVYSVLTLLPQDSALASRCTLSLLSGGAEIQLPGSDSWQTAADGMVLEAGTRVKTPPTSHVLLTFFEGSTIKLEPGADVEVQRVEQADGQRTEIVLKQWLGKTWSRVVRKADPGSRYEIRTPSAYALVRGTLFETEVDEAGSTVVRTIEGLVSVGAQNEEIELAAGQEVGVTSGAPPSEPQPIPPADSELNISVSMPAVASVCDPAWSCTGYLPNGLAFNQIAGSDSSLLSEGDQVITISEPVAGVYRIVLRAVADGTGVVELEGLSKGETVFRHVGAYDMTAGSEWLLKVALEFEAGELRGASVGDIEPLGDRAPEKLVPADLEEASLVPIKPPETTWGPSSTGEPGTTGQTRILSIVSIGGGSVVEPGQGVFSYEVGTEVDLVARPNAGWVFYGWTGNVADPSSPATTITMDHPEWVTANFLPSTGN